MKILLAKRNLLRAGWSLAQAPGGSADYMRVPSGTMSHSDRTWPYCCPCVAPVAPLMAPWWPNTSLTCDRCPPLLGGGSGWHCAVSGFPAPRSATSPRAGSARLCVRGGGPGLVPCDCAAAGGILAKPPRARAPAGRPMRPGRSRGCGSHPVVRHPGRPKTHVREQGVSKPPRHNPRLHAVPA